MTGFKQQQFLVRILNGYKPSPSRAVMIKYLNKLQTLATEELKKDASVEEKYDDDDDDDYEYSGQDDDDLSQKSL